MTIDNNCLETKIDECRDTQTRQKEACKDSGNFNTIAECISDAAREFERCKDQAERDCEIQEDTAIVQPKATTPPPTENIPNRTETSPPPPSPSSLPSSPLPSPSSLPSSPLPSSPSLPLSPLPSSPLPLPLLTTPTPAQRGPSPGVIAAISIAGVVGLVLFGTVFCLYKRHKKNKDVLLPTAMEGGGNGAQSNNRAALSGHRTNFSVRSPATPPGVRSPAPPGVAEGHDGMRYRAEKLREAAELLLKYTGDEASTPAQAADKVLRNLGDDQGDRHEQQPISSTTTREQEGPMGAAGGGAVDHGDAEPHKLGPDSPAIDNPVSEEYTGGGLTPDQAAEEVLLKLGYQPISPTTTREQEGPMVAGGGAVDHGDDKPHELGPASPAIDNPVSNDHEEIPGDVEECLEEIISKIEKDLKATTSVIKTQPMTTTPNQELVPTSPDNPKQKVGQEGDDSPRAARYFWGRIDLAAKDNNIITRLKFPTPETSPTKSSAAVSPVMSGGHQV